MAQERITWTSRIGFVLASAGAAVGLGAIWKFPYMAGTNGGSVFVLPFILLDRKSTRLNSSHNRESRMPSSA